MSTRAASTMQSSDQANVERIGNDKIERDCVVAYEVNLLDPTFSHDIYRGGVHIPVDVQRVVFAADEVRVFHPQRFLVPYQATAQLSWFTTEKPKSNASASSIAHRILSALFLFTKLLLLDFARYAFLAAYFESKKIAASREAYGESQYYDDTIVMLVDDSTIFTSHSRKFYCADSVKKYLLNLFRTTAQPFGINVDRLRGQSIRCRRLVSLSDRNIASPNMMRSNAFSSAKILRCANDRSTFGSTFWGLPLKPLMFDVIYEDGHIEYAVEAQYIYVCGRQDYGT